MDKIIIVVERSAGNETVGQAWVETFEYDPMTPLKQVAEEMLRVNGGEHRGYFSERVMITIPREVYDE